MTAVDTLSSPISYAWTGSCPGLSTAGTFNNPNAQNPAWTAPSNTTGTPRACTIQVTASAVGLTKSGSVTETVNAVSLPPTECGEERWSVKTGTDPDAHRVNLGSVTPTSIGAMRNLVKPPSLPEDNRLQPVETTVWMLDGLLTLYKEEDDSDYHLVVQDEAGNTMTTEIPLPSCVGAGSPFASGIVAARSQFDSHLTATTSFKMANIPVRVTGVRVLRFSSRTDRSGAQRHRAAPDP